MTVAQEVAAALTPVLRELAEIRQELQREREINETLMLRATFADHVTVREAARILHTSTNSVRRRFAPYLEVWPGDKRGTEYLHRKYLREPFVPKKLASSLNIHNERSRSAQPARDAGARSTHEESSRRSAEAGVKPVSQRDDSRSTQSLGESVSTSETVAKDGATPRATSHGFSRRRTR